MSPRPHALGLRTKKSPFPRTGVGQNSSALVFRSDPGASFRLTGLPHWSPSRWPTHRSSAPAPPPRVDAIYRLPPSGDSIGHPSEAGVFTPTASTGSTRTAGPQAEKCGSAAATPASIPTTTTIEPTRMARALRPFTASLLSRRDHLDDAQGLEVGALRHQG